MPCGLFPRRCRQPTTRPTPASLPTTACVPGALPRAPIPAASTAIGVDAGGRQITVDDAARHELGAPVGLRIPLQRLHIFPAPRGRASPADTESRSCASQVACSISQRCSAGDAAVRSDPERRHRRRPEHGRLRQGLSRADVREVPSRREGRLGRHRPRRFRLAEDLREARRPEEPPTPPGISTWW